MKLEEKIWIEKYRPKTLEECILPDYTRKELNSFIKKGVIPNMLFSGKAGIGKTATAKAFLNDVGAEYITINGSMKGNIDTLRNDMQAFASTVSFNGEKKFIIIDEADYLSQNTQAALRGFIEEYSKNCGYILTCNYKNRIIDAIQSSRLIEVDFTFRGEERKFLAVGVYKRIISIFEQEGITYDGKDVQRYLVEYLKKSDDIRRLISGFQRASIGGVFDPSIIDNSGRFIELVSYIKNKNFTDMRKWVGENADIDSSTIYREIFDLLENEVKPDFVPILAIILAKYQHYHPSVADTELNLVAAICEVMVECM